MQRREFIAFLGAAGWPLIARAQQTERTRLIGVLMANAESDLAAQSEMTVLRDALTKLGWTEGVNLRIELRWGGGDADKIRRLAKELVDLRPDAILGQSTLVAEALAHETRTIPIVFVNVTDPVASGISASLARPGGNITGFSLASSEQGGKWVELLKEIAPRTRRMALLFNPETGVLLQNYMSSIRTAASSFDVEVKVAPVHARDEIEGVVAAQARDPGGGLIVMILAAIRGMSGVLVSSFTLSMILPNSMSILAASHCASRKKRVRNERATSPLRWPGSRRR